MATIDDALRTQIRNIEQSTGRSMDDWAALVKASGQAKHGEILAWLKTEHGLTHGNANLVALTALRGPAAPTGDALSTRSTAARRRPSGRSTTGSSTSPGASAATSSSHRSRPTWRCAAPSSSRPSGRLRRAARDRAQPQGRRAGRPARGDDRDVHPPRPPLVTGRAGRRGPRLAPRGVRPGLDPAPRDRHGGPIAAAVWRGPLSSACRACAPPGFASERGPPVERPS